MEKLGLYAPPLERRVDALRKVLSVDWPLCYQRMPLLTLYKKALEMVLLGSPGHTPRMKSLIRKLFGLTIWVVILQKDWAMVF